MKSPEDVLAEPNASAIDRRTAELYLKIVRSGRCPRLSESGTNDVADDRPLIAVVPGAFHREHRHTGADGARVLRLVDEMGVEGEVIPLGSFGPIATNADRIADYLTRQGGRRIVLVSLSKGGADAKAALRRSPEAFANVVTWVSFSGLTNGTPLVAWLRRQPLRWLAVRVVLWWHGHQLATLEELTDSPDGPHAGWPPLPDHLRVIHVASFPLREHLRHPWAPRGHDRLAPLGPNDGGGVLLSGLLDAPGEILPIWGADHYLQPSWDLDPALRRLFHAAIGPATASPATASNEPATKSTA